MMLIKAEIDPKLKKNLAGKESGLYEWHTKAMVIFVMKQVSSIFKINISVILLFFDSPLPLPEVIEGSGRVCLSTLSLRIERKGKSAG